MRKITTSKKPARRAPASPSAGRSSHARSVKLVDLAERDLAAQHQYVEAFGEREIDLTVPFAEAFIQGMRNVGYRNTATALDELVDNALQANATAVHVATDVEDDNIRAIAVIDTGHGMEPQMVRIAVSWGGSHRAYYNDLSGFGRFGFGLPTASIHVGTKYTVYSKLADRQMYSVEIDLTRVNQYSTTSSGRVVVPEARPDTERRLPSWVQNYLDTKQIQFSSGTIVVLENIDQLSWRSARRFHSEMLQHLGVYYRKFIGRHSLYVNGASVEPLDPLFVTEGAKFYDLDADRAEEYPKKTIVVNDDDGVEVGRVDLRFSYIPPTFPNIDKTTDRGKKNARWNVLKQYNDGIIVMRAGRQIDVVRPTTWKDLIHRDYYWGIELDFTPTLDDLFSVNATKQQVILKPRVWQLLEQYGVRKTLDEMRERNLAERARRRESAVENAARPAEKAAIAAANERLGIPDLDPSRIAEGERNFQSELKRRTAHAPESAVTEIAAKLERELSARPYRISLERGHEGPFYRVEAFGGQRRLILNMSHEFYKQIYGLEKLAPAVRVALDTLLLAIADVEFEAKDQRLAFYRHERLLWSQVLTRLVNHLDSLVDYELPEIESLEQEFKFGGEGADLDQTA